MTKKRHETPFSDALLKRCVPGEGAPPSLSLIIPTFNCSEKIGDTLESIERQHYPGVEVIVVDAGSTDRTLEILSSYHHLISRVYTVETFQLFDMVNRGITLASGRYISVLFPGTFYLSDLACQLMGEKVAMEHEPDLLYCGSVQREGRRAPRVILVPFGPKLLSQGVYLTTLPACWFRADVFERVGPFDSTLAVRSGFELLCRLAKEPKVRLLSLDRVYIDFDFGHFTYGKLLHFASDTWRILSSHYGFWKALRWFLGFNKLTLIRYWFHTLKLRLSR